MRHCDIGFPHEELEFSINNSKLIVDNDEDEYDDGNIFDHGYRYEMFFINEQNEIIDKAYYNFRVNLEKFEKNREKYSDLKYKICINIFRDDETDFYRK